MKKVYLSIKFHEDCKNKGLIEQVLKSLEKLGFKPICMIRDYEKFLKSKKRHILISDTTGPEFMQAIKKAVAIVTDEGGMMSHAAIISREFNIPCVVGTKYATKVFKDGDKIEVNANNGVVRRIN